MGTEALMEEKCFNALSVSIYRLLYKEFLSTRIKIRKPNVQQPLPRDQGINNGHKVRRQSISQERGSRLNSFVIRRMFTGRRSTHVSSYDFSPGSRMPFHSVSVARN